MSDRELLFHRTWLGLAQPIEGLVFSVPVLADAQIAPGERPEVSRAFEAQLLEEDGEARIRDIASFFRDFLGYDTPGMLVPRDELPEELSFYAADGGQQIRPSFALGRGPFTQPRSDDPLALFADLLAPTPTSTPSSTPTPTPSSPPPRYLALVWDLTETGTLLDLDEPEATTGPWRYPPTAKFERLLRHTGVPIGFLFNGRELRLVYAPEAESTAHLTFRVEHMRGSEGRPLLSALDLLLHARRAHAAAEEFTLEGLLKESRRRQADITDELAAQVFEAVETLLHGFEAAAGRDCTGDKLDWLRPALEREGDHLYQGVLSVVLRLVFLLYAEDQALLPVEHPLYAQHLSLGGLYESLSQDRGAHPESMHQRFGAYGQLLALFRAVFYGVRHGDFELPPRHGKLFDPNSYPFLEGRLPDSIAPFEASARADARPPSIDDETIFRVLHRLVVFGGQRLSYRALDVEQIGSVYESLIGYHVVRLEGPAVRVGGQQVWVEAAALRKMSPSERGKFLKEVCRLGSGPVQAIEKAVREAKGDDDFLEALSAHASGRRDEALRHRASKGRLVLQPGEERRRSGSHYTPRSLTEGVVRRTLEPLLNCLGDDRSAEQLLQLKICDPAMGSGAFLVAVCRELASEVVAAWTREGKLESILEEHGDAHLHARRLVSQKCLYGVDKNPAAVELAKLSLWLVTLSRHLPFTFVDHALRHGDSLVGLDFDQIAAFHWKPPGQVESCRYLLTDALEEAIALRQRILDLGERDDPASQADKRRLFKDSQLAIDRVRTVADACVGAFFAETSDRAREAERRRRLDLIELWLGKEREAERATTEEQSIKAFRASQAAYEQLFALAEEAREKLAPFHWWIEFPEVFFEKRPDPLQRGEVTGRALMEGVVGNPPFGGKNTISAGHVDGYVSWLQAIHEGAHGNSDLSAHFFLRASRLLGEHGAFGLIATKTIAEGDTRTTGLQKLVDNGWLIYDATEAFKWPGKANVTTAIVHAAHGLPKKGLELRLNGEIVSTINSHLKAKPERDEAQVLLANANTSFQGTIILGMGFTLTPDERDALVAKDSRNAERIFPYIGGQEVNTSPTQTFDRYVISFGEMSLEEAERWPDLIKIVREMVKPERDRNKREVRRRYWWRFGETTPALVKAIAPLKRCLVTLFTTKHLSFSFQPTNRIFANSLYAFPFDRFTQFAVLQSRIHEPWARLLSSSLEDRLRYAASDCFETFPFPHPDPRTAIPNLEAIGEKLYQARASFMVETDQGLTKTYNALKDPASEDGRILELRILHEEMDRAVLDAYGWGDISVPPFCPMDDADREAIAGFEDEVIDRLYVLNAERAREEERLGMGRAKGGKKAGAGKRAGGKSGAKKKQTGFGFGEG